jgi:hypothetical protein
VGITATLLALSGEDSVAERGKQESSSDLGQGVDSKGPPQGITFFDDDGVAEDLQRAADSLTPFVVSSKAKRTHNTTNPNVGPADPKGGGGNTIPEV